MWSAPRGGFVRLGEVLGVFFFFFLGGGLCCCSFLWCFTGVFANLGWFVKFLLVVFFATVAWSISLEFFNGLE